MSSYKIQTGVRLEEEALEKVRFIAKKQKRSLNSLVEYLIDCEINRYETENGTIQINLI
jgi:predicted HicB family RNase H-like nuclease